ncbi:N-acetylmuramoyl-L-alanine amidase [Mycobacterium sp. 1465703.0]|uniref:N-acetylmuramoyl-L-alanine amidase n=1 Tax=Mycobacterium sp. 1465703.0 TaxID=1834078 RepID=UPI0008023539|nr:N-acetylmuramoyl-L-alanine amidase [Mycobacterium sp. 1465703.0]OBI98083.1 hypothetical protein A5625_05200 [Mycobacterium sp. 1465703.0]
MPSVDDYALAIIAEGERARTDGPDELRHPVITVRGIQIALATVYVESDFVMYANPNNPESESFPHDADSYDEDSVGLFQQRIEWWGTTAEEMDPAESAAMFFHHLVALDDDYNDPNVSPGTFAQDVQGSAYPDRYDQRFNDAVSLYNRLTNGGTPVSTTTAIDPRLAALQAARPDFNEYPNWSTNCEPRNGVTVDGLFAHTEDGSDTDNADGLAWFLRSTEGTDNPRSYHYTISTGYPKDDGVTVVDVVDTDYAAWAVGASNLRSINYCIAGSESYWLRADWIQHAARAIDVMAYLMVQDAIKYNVPPKVIAPPYNSDLPGIADHRYCSVYLKDGNDHTDVDGPDGPYGPPFVKFPWDILTAAVAKYWAIANAAAPPADPGPPATFAAPAGDEALRKLLEQFLGPFDETTGLFTGWPQLAGDPIALADLQAKVNAGTPLSLVDGLAAERWGIKPASSGVTPPPPAPAPAAEDKPAKAPTKKPPAKKAPVKKPPAKKPPAKKAPVKTPARKAAR